MYFIQHCFTCCPSDSTVSEDAAGLPRTVVTLVVPVRRSNHWSARSHPQAQDFFYKKDNKKRKNRNKNWRKQEGGKDTEERKWVITEKREWNRIAIDGKQRRKFKKYEMEKKKKIFQMNAYLNLHLTFIALLWIYSWFLQRLDLIKLQYFVKYVKGMRKGLGISIWIAMANLNILKYRFMPISHNY